LEEVVRAFSLKEFGPAVAPPEAVSVGIPLLTSPFTAAPLPYSAPKKGGTSSVW